MVDAPPPFASRGSRVIFRRCCAWLTRLLTRVRARARVCVCVCRRPTLADAVDRPRPHNNNYYYDCAIVKGLWWFRHNLRLSISLTIVFFSLCYAYVELDVRLRPSCVRAFCCSCFWRFLCFVEHHVCVRACVRACARVS